MGKPRPPGKPNWRMVSSTMGWRISLITTSNSMNKVKAPVSAYPVQRAALLFMALAFLRAYERPSDAERVLGLGVTVAPEHIGRRHQGRATRIHCPLPPAIHVLH